jgi:hypothetical protein
MDAQLRKAERLFMDLPNGETLVNFLRQKLRAGEIINLTSGVINDYWDEQELRIFLETLPINRLAICGHSIGGQPWGWLTSRIRNTIWERFVEDYENHDVDPVISVAEASAGSARDGFHVEQIGFGPNGEGAASFYALTMYRGGYSEHHLAYECEDRELELDTNYIGAWGRGNNLSYNNSCGPSCPGDSHLGTEDHVFGVDDMRSQLMKGILEDQLKAYDFIKLKLKPF